MYFSSSLFRIPSKVFEIVSTTISSLTETVKFYHTHIHRLFSSAKKVPFKTLGEQRSIQRGGKGETRKSCSRRPDTIRPPTISLLLSLRSCAAPLCVIFPSRMTILTNPPNIIRSKRFVNTSVRFCPQENECSSLWPQEKVIASKRIPSEFHFQIIAYPYFRIIELKN